MIQKYFLIMKKYIFLNIKMKYFINEIKAIIYIKVGLKPEI
jgi:hypothetical protein